MENRENPSSPNGETPPKAPAAARGRLRLVAKVLCVVTLFGVALGGSWLFREFTREPDPEPAHVEKAPQPPKKAPPSGNAVEILDRGDQALSHHRFGEALAFYQELLEREPGKSALVDYRIGLCNELLGRLTDAHTAYRKSISGATTPVVALAAHLGMARCHLRDNHPIEARRLLSPFLLDEERHKGIPQTLLAGVRYLNALAFAQETLPASAAGQPDDRPISFSAVGLEVPFYLEELGPTTEASKEIQVETLAPPLRLQRQNDPRDTLVLRIELTEQPAWKLFDRLSDESGLRTAWTPLAKRGWKIGVSVSACAIGPSSNCWSKRQIAFDLVCQLPDARRPCVSRR